MKSVTTALCDPCYKTLFAGRELKEEVTIGLVLGCCCECGARLDARAHYHMVRVKELRAVKASKR